MRVTSVRRTIGVGVLLATLASVLPASLAAAERHSIKEMGEPREEMALVYVLREKRFQGGGRTMFVYADDALLGVLDNGCYAFGYVGPGERLLWLNWAKIARQVELEAGETYYFTAFSAIDEVDEATGLAMIEAFGCYSTPLDKELRTAEKHIEERYGKAQVASTKTKEHAGSERKREKHVAQWPEIDLSAYDTLYVADFEMADPKAEARTKREYLVETAPGRMADDVVDKVGEGVFDEVHRGLPEEPVPGTLVLEGRITQYKPGSETARFMLAGTGSAKLDFEVRLVDAATGEEVGRFDDERSWSWGGAAGAGQGIQELERNITYEIALYLERCKNVIVE